MADKEYTKQVAEKRNNREAGRTYEDLAAGYLRNKGYVIREQNFRAPSSEIDLIAERDGMLVMCEVKYRSTERYGDPAEAVDIQKQKKICRAALYYYMKNRYGADRPCRFDVIAVYGDGTLRHVENAFEFIR